jgi:adenosine deaminase
LGTGGQAACVAELAADLHRADRPVGLDIAGFPETTYPPRLFEKVLGPAREAGVPLTVHAGEQGRPPDFADAPPELIVEAIERLGARRIGHGTSLAAARSARALVRERGVAIECCPVSNERMGFMPIAGHPLPMFLQEGLLASLATDDPLMFGPFSVAETFDAIAGPLRLDARALAHLTLNGIESAFVSEQRRDLLRRRATLPPAAGR